MARAGFASEKIDRGREERGVRQKSAWRRDDKVERITSGVGTKVPETAMSIQGLDSVWRKGKAYQVLWGPDAAREENAGLAG